jgi:hypothetical protein
MSDDSMDVLVEQAASAFRERDVSGRILPSPAWWDLPAERREALFESQLVSRHMERALHPGGLSSTVRAVLGRLGG